MGQDYATTVVKKKIPKELWRTARASAIAEGITITEWLTKAVHDKVNKNGFHRNQ